MRIILAILCVSVYLTACTSSNVVENQAEIVVAQLPVQHIFVQTIITTGLGPTGITKELWQMKSDGSQPELLYELENLSNEPLSRAFSDQELAAFEEWYNFRGKEMYPPASEIYPFISAREITLSPNSQQLAWIESIYWGPSEGTTTFAMIRLVLLDLMTGKKKVLYEISEHSDATRFRVESDLGGLAWFPDGYRLVFVEGVWGAHQAKWIDVTTGAIENLGMPGEGGIYSSWSPDGTSLVMNSPNTLNILSITNAPPQKDLAGSWGNITGVDWSPDGKTILFAAAKDTYPERLALYSLNVETRALIELPLDENLSYESPKWSPDGKLIAINVRGKWLDWVDKLFIYDIAAQKVVAMLEGRRSSPDFYWVDDSQAILVTMGAPPDTPRTIELFYWQENRTEAIPFPEDIDDAVAIGIF